MRIKLEIHQNVEKIESPLKEIIEKRFKEWQDKNSRHGDPLVYVCSFEWSQSPEYRVERDFWSNIYEGKEVYVHEKILNLWKKEGFLEKGKPVIELQSKGVYFASSKDKKYKITIEEIL